MNFVEQSPSTEWTPLTHGAEVVTEAWFKPDDEPLVVLFRVPQDRFQVDEVTQLLTLEDLLTAAGIALAEVESWLVGDESYAGQDGTNPELKRLLPPPPPDECHLGVYVRLKPSAQEPVGDDRPAEDPSPEQWQTLEVRWKAILGLEAGIEALRMSVDGLRAEMEAEFRKSLDVEDKVHALQTDVAQWTRAKNRVHHTLPKAREFIHRAVWALGVPERKRLDEVHKSHIEPRVPFPELDKVREELDHLQKDRQVLSAQGSAVAQECRGILAEIRGTLNTLHRNAVERARQKRSAKKEKGKHF